MSSVIYEGEICSKRMKTSKEDETKAIMMRPSMPDLVIDRILALLPTKSALRMSFLSKQWERNLSLSPVLDFDESAEIHDDDIVLEKLVEHQNFINILERYLESREKDKTTQVLERFRLRMTRFLLKDYGIVNKWLLFVFKRSVKEVDLSLEIGWNKLVNDKIRWYERLEDLYCVSPLTFFHARYITTLNLEFVRLQDAYSAELRHERVLSSLRNMSLKKVYLDPSALDALIRESPSIECLSLDSCYVQDLKIVVSSSSLKSLKITHCNANVIIEVNEAVNLSRFTLLSQVKLRSVTLEKSFNLKYINIHAQSTLEKNVALQACHKSVEASIHLAAEVDQLLKEEKGFARISTLSSILNSSKFRHLRNTVRGHCRTMAVFGWSPISELHR